MSATTVEKLVQHADIFPSVCLHLSLCT